ncbi:unnamed protein product [Adineta steineri]|uniref:RNA-directed DNA polymerase n=1 Tax=Adineta steineri TaxID=433720 RepID=A0A816DM71_9BILA|nr:unnamed protein product [Adineta steineri]CAF1636561.1 unnamed protein product [Adineta steineri]
MTNTDNENEVSTSPSTSPSTSTSTSTSTPDPVMMVCYRESLSNLVKFKGKDEPKILNFIHNIERIGRMINANDTILYCMCTAKLDGEAKRWYENNITLTTWGDLKPALLERFTTTDSSTKIFEQLKERKQKPEESITTFYDDIIKLCHDYDPIMSDKMIISWLENGVKDSLKISIKRQMKLLIESARTTKAFLKIAKDEEELQEEHISVPDPTPSYMPYFTNAVSTTKPQTTGTVRDTQYSARSISPNRPWQSMDHRNEFDTSYYPPQASHHTTPPESWSASKHRPPTPRRYDRTIQPGYGKSTTSKNTFTTRLKPLHKSANCSPVNIIGEIELEITIRGYRTLTIADVATNLVTDLLLGNDWIQANNIIIDCPQQRIILNDRYNRIAATTTFIEQPDTQLPIFTINDITLPPYSETYVNVKTRSNSNQTTEALFEPIPTFYTKQILITHALLAVENDTSTLTIINANDRPRTLSRNTKLGHITFQDPPLNYAIVSVLPDSQSVDQNYPKTISTKRNHQQKSSCFPSTSQKRKVRFADISWEEKQENEHQCYVCQELFLSRNDLLEHLRAKCYPQDIREQIDNLTTHIMNDNQRQQVQRILWKYGKLFDLRRPSTIKATIQHALETGNHSPVYTPPYRVSYKDEQIQRDEIDKLLKQGIIEESTSPWSSPIVLVRKKDGSVRFCIDYRKLNTITTRDAFPIPRIDDIFDHLSQAGYYTTIDFKSGYFQVGLAEKDRPKTAFSTRDQHYQFTVLPQGVTNGPPAFQRIVSRILGPTRWNYSLAYLDDVIIYSQTFDQHLIHIDDILNRLNEANFRLNVGKCHITQTAIDYLGHRIEHGNIKPNADNIRALLETQRPTTAKEAFRFVKAAEYYRKFIPRFSIIAQPLYKYAPTTKEQRSHKSQSTPIQLADEELNAFDELKRILTNDLVLRIPNDNLPFKIQTDASKIGIGAVLMQTHANGDLPVAYLSKKLTTTQMNWPATEQECYAIIYAIEKWHKYLDGRQFTIETDHKPLLPLNLKQQLNSKCERWRLKLQHYTFTIRYIKGKHNTVADYLSRAPLDKEADDEDDYVQTKTRTTQTDDSMIVSVVTSVTTRAQTKRQQSERNDDHMSDQSYDGQAKRNDKSTDNSSCVEANIEHHQMMEIDNKIIPFTYEQIRELQQQDEETKQIMMNINTSDAYVIQDDMLMKNSTPPVPFIPKGRFRSDIIKVYHDTPANGAHFGRDRTIHKIQQRYFWPNMITDIRNHIKTCIPCLQNNHIRRKPPGALKPIKPPEGIWQLLTMDFHGPITPATRSGNKYIISLTDVLSKFVITKAVRDCTASTAARFVTEEVILKYGTPKCILTDNGTHFTASMMAELFKKIGVTHLYSTPYHPMTNGQIERYNATMDSKIAALSNENRTNWDEQLPFVTFNYNTSIHTTTGHIPFEMMYGRSPILPFDQQEPVISLAQDTQHIDKLKQHLLQLTEQAKINILKQQQKYKQRYDRYRSNPTHKINDLVLIKTLHRRNKFDIRYEGPFRIIQQLVNTTKMNKYSSCNYKTPYQRLIERYGKWKPAKLKKEFQLKEDCERGLLTPFQQPHNYSCYFIHKEADIFTLDYLIDEAKQTYHYSLDTEGDPIKHVPATIQVEFIRLNAPSIVIIIEVQHLPPPNSPLYMKIQHLCSIIFCSNNNIYSWGNPVNELESFLNLDLFVQQIQIKGINVQEKYDSTGQCGLQSVIQHEYKQYLDKLSTIADWSCGLDFCLGTYMPSRHVYGEQREYQIEEEKKYRTMLKEYAINDVFAVTKIATDINLIKILTTPPTTAEHQQEQKDEPEAHEQVELNNNQQEQISIELELTPSDFDIGIFDREHESGENQRATSYDIEPISEDELPEVVQLRPPTQATTTTQQIHQVNGSRIKTRSYYLGPQLYIHEHATPNQISSRRRRANRYRSEVVRRIYHGFNHRDVKTILRGINVEFLNVKISKHGELYIGVKSPTAAEELEELLHKRMFTREHYYHHKKKRRNN